MRRATFFHKLILFFVLIGVIPLGILATLSYSLSTNILEKSLYQEASNSLGKIHSDIEDLFSEYDNILNVLSQDEQLQKVLQDEISLREHYSSIYEKIYFLTSSKKYKFPIYVLGAEGAVVFSTTTMPYNHRSDSAHRWGLFRQLYQDDFDGNNTVITSNYFEDNLGDTVIFSLGKKLVNSSGDTIGYIIADITRESVISIINSFTLSAISNIVVMDQFYYMVINLKEPNIEGSFYRNEVIVGVGRAVHGGIQYRYEKNLIAFHRSPNSFIQIIGTVPLNAVGKNLGYIKRLIVIILLVSLTFAVIASYFMARNVVKPIKLLVRGMKQVEEGNFSQNMNLQRQDEIKLLEDSYNQMVVKLKDSMDDLVQKQKQLREAEIKILQAQINPHFLYNTLDAVKWMAKLKKFDEVTIIATQLGALLRNSIDTNQEFLTVRENLEIVKSYIKIQNIRYDNLFSVIYKIDEHMLDYEIPKLLLQPLVENAIVHGFIQGEKGSLLCIEAYKKDGLIIFKIQDNGVGMSKEQLLQALCQTGSDHIGLHNVDHRIKLYYGDMYGLSLESVQGAGTTVTVNLPASREIKSAVAEKSL